MGHVTLLRLKRQLKRLGIEQTVVAREAGVGRTTVAAVLNGHTKSAKVLRVARRLVDEVKASSA